MDSKVHSAVTYHKCAWPCTVTTQIITAGYVAEIANKMQQSTYGDSNQMTSSF